MQDRSWKDPYAGDSVRSLTTGQLGEVLDGATLRFLVAWEDGTIEVVERFSGDVYVERRGRSGGFNADSVQAELSELQHDIDRIEDRIDDLEAEKGDLEFRANRLRDAMEEAEELASRVGGISAWVSV